VIPDIRFGVEVIFQATSVPDPDVSVSEREENI
jgi:hypothetical protein